MSVGAGPLTLPLSYRMLKHALKKADYVSYRDEGSKALIESKIDIDAPIYPDVAHSLGCQPISTTKMASEPRTRQGQLTIAVNPMPVYDKRYWYLPDDDKFQDYIEKVCLLCETILNDGNKLTLFSTQIRDENVIDDIMERLSKNSNISAWLPQISEAKCAEVSELMSTLNQADVIVATRFHATVLPLQLNKPTIGICYYRKAAELLDEFGMQDFHVDIDHFDAETLIQQYRAILPKRTDIQRKINSRFNQYRDLLNEQYGKILGLIQN